MKFIKGKWYKNPEWASTIDFIKYDSLDALEDSIIGLEYIVFGDYRKIKNNWHSPAKCIEASFEEYSKYLPEGHPDLIKTIDYEIF